MATLNTFLTQSEAAETLRVCTRTLARMRKNGTGPKFFKAGNRVLYPVPILDAWVESRTFQSTSEVELA